MKRKMVILTLLVLFALSLTASVVMPAPTQAAAKSGVTTLASLRFTEYDWLNPPECPSPIDPGC